MKRYNLRQHAPLIFTSLGVIGIFGTGAVGVWSGIKATKILEEHEDTETLKEKLLLTWKVYIWTLLSATLSSTFVIASHRLSSKQIATLASISAAGATSFSQYRDKVREVIGVDAERDLYEEVRCKTDWGIYPKLPTSDSDLPLDHYYYDGYSKRYFYSNPERIQQAIYHLNRNFQIGQTISVNEWYMLLGLDGIDGGDDIKWYADTFWESGLVPWIDIYTQMDADENGEIIHRIFFEWDPLTEVPESWR